MKRSPVFERKIENFLFAPVDPRAAGAFRIALAIIITIVFWPQPRVLDPDIAALPAFYSFYRDVYFTTGCWVASLVLIGLFGVGWRPRVTGPLLALTLLPAIAMFGAERSRQVLLIALLAFSFLRSDLRFGLFTRNAERRGADCGPMWPIRLIQIQLSVTYLVNAIAKATPEYMDGSLLVEMSQLYSNFRVELSSGSLELVGLSIPIQVGAVATILVEFALGLGFWFRRTRIPTAILGVVFHLSLKLVVRIGWFDWTCIFLYLVFLLPFETRPADRSRQ